jgi:HEAT repeat protein
VAGLADYFLDLLKTGRRAKVEELARARPERLLALLELLRDTGSSMAVRLGIGAVMEEFQGTGVTDVLVPGLGELTRHDDRLVRADACHFLSLVGGKSILPFMRACLDDPDAEVREIAAEVLGETPPGAAD